jgi:hypothetical protein
MKTSLVALLIAVTILLLPTLSRSQGETAVPFLLITTAPEGNGMAGTTASQITTDAFATIANHGQLGLFSLRNLFNASTYVPRTDWLPQFYLPDLGYGVTAINAGYNFTELLSLPFDLSAGIGYSRVSLNLGTFVVTNSSGPTPMDKFDSEEYCDSYSFGIGLDYHVRLGLGFNLKNIESRLSPIGTESEMGAGSASVSATNFGLLLEVPMVDLFTNLSGASLKVAPRIHPFLDFSFGYVRANAGNEVVHIDAAQADPLPRTSVVGLSIGTGLAMKSGKTEWQLASFKLVHHVDDLLVIRHDNGSFDYQSGLGDIRFWDNVVLGKFNSKVKMRRGWQVQVAEVLCLRGGSVESPGLSYTTSGYSICLGGLTRLMSLITTGPVADESWMGFVADHFDLQFHTATYDQTHSPIAGTRSQSLNLVVKGCSL